MARRSPGEVRDAITSYLRGHDSARIADIQAAVERKLGGKVAPSSIRSYLRLNTPALFERTGHGQYKLRKGR